VIFIARETFGRSDVDAQAEEEAELTTDIAMIVGAYRDALRRLKHNVAPSEWAWSRMSGWIVNVWRLRAKDSDWLAGRFRVAIPDREEALAAVKQHLGDCTRLDLVADVQVSDGELELLKMPAGGFRDTGLHGLRQGLSRVRFHQPSRSSAKGKP
jgi:hypothetical protein